jgi:hypothetical protein
MSDIHGDSVTVVDVVLFIEESLDLMYLNDVMLVTYIFERAVSDNFATIKLFSLDLIKLTLKHIFHVHPQICLTICSCFGALPVKISYSLKILIYI